MDERHWAIAGKIQETFKIGGYYDNPTLLEEFMCEEATLNKVNKFLRAGGPCRLFFYCQKPESGNISTHELQVTGNLATLKDCDLDKVTVLYFLRNGTDKDVDSSHMEHNVFCGELKHNTIEAFTSLMSDIYIPLMHAQNDWGHCNKEEQTHLMHSMDKFVIALNETATSVRHSRQWMLRQTENVMLNDFKQQRIAALDVQLISQYESLVSEWIITIDTILNDSSAERFMDPNAGPLSELERWCRRQRLLTSVTEQLKAKECKAVIAVLIQAKSRLLKKWKATDAALTDGLNDSKDKMKYLESLKRHFDKLYYDATPSSIINSAIPGLISSMKQMDSISRYYARTGFLGIILTKVTNQLVIACKDQVKSCTINQTEDHDRLWDFVAQEALTCDPSTVGDPQHKLLKNQVESRLKQPVRGFKTKEGKDIGFAEDGLINRLRACLMLQGFFREALRSLRDSLGGSQSISHYSSVSSFVQSIPGQRTRSNTGASSTSRIFGMSSPSKRMEAWGHGVPIADEDAIMAHLDIFCGRIRQFLEVISTLSQYSKLTKTLIGIPRPRRKDLISDDGSDQDEYAKYRKPKDNDLLEDPIITVTTVTPDRTLQSIAEEDSKEAESEDSEPWKDKEDAHVSHRQGDEVHEILNNKHSLAEEDLQLLRKYYPVNNEEEGPNLTSIVEEHVSLMNNCMRNNVTTKTMLDVESKDKTRFERHYAAFREIVQELEAFLSAYIQVIFAHKMKAQQGLDVIMKFYPVLARNGMRSAIGQKYVEMFNWYEDELEEVLQIYECQKESPQTIRNAPPVAGAICWSRQLLNRIEDPMKIFRDNRAITQLTDFGRIVRIYNRLATALVTYESLLFTRWKNQIEQARSGLKATLFIHHPDTKEIVVNADERILELIHEAKWLTRLDIAIPESAQSILEQEGRFKKYQAHLELVLKEYRHICEQVPKSLQLLLQPHIQRVQQQLQPGLSTLSWGSMNIDAFVHQIHRATDKLKQLVKEVKHLMSSQVAGVIQTISNFLLFDLEMAFSKTWPPEEFREMMMESIEEKSEQLRDSVGTVLEGLQKIASLLTMRKVESGKRTSEKKIALILEDDELEKERQHAVKEEELVMDLIGHYKDQVYDAVLQCTSRSLAALSEAAGCQGEVVRALSPFSTQNEGANMHSEQMLDSETSSPTPQERSQLDSTCSHSLTIQSDRPVSRFSQLSDTSWSLETKPLEPTFLQFEILIKFNVPVIIVEPTLDTCQKVIVDVSNAILGATNEIVWPTKEGEEAFFTHISVDGNIQELQAQLSCVIEELGGFVNRHLFHFGYYNFLWKDDMYGNFNEFIMADPGALAIKREVEHYLCIEKKLLSIPSHLPVGPVCLQSNPIKDALHGFCMAWKTTFASVLHEEAKKKLDAAVAYRSNVKSRLEQHIQTLDQLNSALHLLEELRDMENKIDDVYLPIETMYLKLREFELRLPREEVALVDQLREKWLELLELAEEIRVLLLKERRGAFEQELDKQVKTFVVEVIQFRNAFDAQGPAVPGILPAEAVTRLQDFQMRYEIYNTKRKTLDSVSKLFGINCKPFPELDRTGEELELLSQLYGLFQKFIRFDAQFRETLWAEVNLESSYNEVESYWDECLALPSRLKDWDAYLDLKTKLQNYLEVFPLLQNLASKGSNRFNLPEIRNRHWLEVMQVTNSSFQLEANVFKLCHLLDIGLIRHKAEIEEICRGASQELKLEIKMRVIEEEWTEQVLNFEHYKHRGPIYLDKIFTQRLLEQLEDAEALLAVMLTSKYISPLRDEAASWAEKLKEVAEVLELWLEVQDIWQYLEAVFSNSVAVKELPQEAKRFARIDKGWTKMMKRAFDTRNVLQCCYGGEVPKAVVLRHIHEELEICFKSLMGYLDNKRRIFPRFYFVSDSVLLALLSRPNDLESLRPHLRCFFMQLHDVRLEKANDHNVEEGSIEDVQSSRVPGGLLSPHDRRASSLQLPRATTPPKIDKRLQQHYSLNPALLHAGSSMLPSEGLVDDVIAVDATTVLSSDGEVLPLVEKVSLSDGVEVWIGKLCDSVGRTLKEFNASVVSDCNSGIAMEEWAHRYPSQVCRLGMLYHWTKECEQSISEVKYDRKALQALLRKYQTHTGRLSSVLSRGAWRTLDEPMLLFHKARLESMITQSMYLRDVIDNICSRKIREITDFEWRRSIRCYKHSSDENPSEPMIWILDTAHSYGSEFNGTDCGVALYPATERCFLSMSLALNQCLGARIVGPVGVGKTETVRGLANIFGNFLGMFHCSEVFSPVSIGKICQGMSMDGCWGCFDEGQILSAGAMSVLMDHIQAVILAVREKQSSVVLMDGTEIPLKKNVGLFMTTGHPAQKLPSSSFPTDIAGCFRTISLVKPDLGHILKAKCSSLGFRAAAVLAMRLKVLTELVKDQLPQECQHHFSVPSLTAILKRASQKKRSMRDDKMAEKREETSRSESSNSETPTLRLVTHGLSLGVKLPGTVGMRKSGTPNPMTVASKQEHAIVAQNMEDIIGPRLSAENLNLFKTIVKDCFLGLPDSPTSTFSAKSRSFDIEAAIESKAQDLGLLPHKPWVTCCLQLYHLSQVHHGIIVAGRTGSGKSSCIQTVVEALCLQSRRLSQPSQASKASQSSENMHKLLRLYPLMVDDLSLMFGFLDQNGDWVDGIFTSAIRKANRNQSTTWLCLDGPLVPLWADNFNSILSFDKTLHQQNGDKLWLSDNVMILFETDNLGEASPAAVARSGIIYLDEDTVGWKPLASAWLKTRKHREEHVLHRAFHKTLDPITTFVMQEAKPRLCLSEVGMFRTCLGLLSAMLADNIEIGGELHIERLFLFCLIWTFGGLLDPGDRKRFSDLLKNLSTALPDDDRDICVFDYYVDESGEWDPWHSRVPETVYADNQDILGEVFIDTIDTIRSRILMEFAAASGQNVLLVGPHGCGKTALINTFLDMQDPQTSVCKRLVFSASSTATQLQQFVEANIYHRQGFVYGAKEKKMLKVFIDDINLPEAVHAGIQHCNELLRQLLDDKVLYTLQKPFKSRTIEGLTVFSAMALTDSPAVVRRGLSERLLRHFAVFVIPAASEEPLRSVISGILEANMTWQESPGLDFEVHKALVNMSCDMLIAVQNVLQPTPMPGRHHYFFTLKDISNCFQCLRRLADESKADESTVIALWKHEIIRIMRDRICRFTDLLWFDDKLDQTVAQHWSRLEEHVVENFVTFPTDTRIYQRPVTIHGTKQIKVMLQPVENLRDLHTCLNAHLTRYNEEFGNVYLDVMLSDFTIAHVVRMHRILSFHHGGHMLLIGAVGSHLSRLCRLALHVADIPIHKVDSSKQSNFFDGLRSAIRLSGSEGKIITLLFSSRDLSDLAYMDAINSLLVSGEYPHLFSNDELDGLLQAIHPAMKREFPSSSMDPMKFFVSRVKSNLHIIMCLQPSNDLLCFAYKYPGLLSGCQINWLCDWPQETLLGEASYFIAKHQLTQEFEDLRDNITTCLANIHSFVLRDCNQLPWAGDQNPEVTLTMVKVHDKKKDQMKVESCKVPNLPYAKTILHERIMQQHRNKSISGKNEVYIGPTMYRRFMECFRYLYTSKAQERTDSVEQLIKILATLDKTRADAKVMKKAIKTIKGSFEEACKNTADLLQQLTNKVTILEKLKAKVGLSKSLDAYLHLTEFESEEEEEDELLQEEEYDDYDAEFDKMREATLKTRQVQAKEEYVEVQRRVALCRIQLEHARKQVLIHKSKVDRQCVERLKAFQAPPVLVGQVMEMVMILIGKRIPSQRIQETRDYSGKEDLSSRMSSSSSSSKFISKKSKAMKDSERFDRAQWKSMQLTMNDTTKFVDMLHNVSWEEGLPSNVLQAVVSYLAVNSDGQLGVTGEGSMPENASEKPFAAVKTSVSPQDRTSGITISSAKHSSEDCAALLLYAIAIVEYSRRCGPLRAAIDRLHELEREIEENERMRKQAEDEPKEEEEKAKEEAEVEVGEEDLPRLQQEVRQLQEEFDKSVVQKHSLHLELQSMNERLKAACEVMESLKDQEDTWRQHVKDNGSNELLIANCLTAAGFLTYCGALNMDTRLRMGEFFMQVCEHHGLPLHKKLLFHTMELVDFLYKPIDIMKLEMLHLPTTRLMLENSCFLMQEASMNAWPLICDPTSRVIDWLIRFHQGRELVVVKYHEMRSQLENCLADGTSLLMTDCEIKQLVTDARFIDTIASCVSFVNRKAKFKVIVTDHEVECDPRFRLFLHTTDEPQTIPHVLAAYTSTVFFQQSRQCVEEELLHIFMAQEKSRLDNENSALRQEKEENMLFLEKFEKQMCEQLSSDVRLMNNIQATKRLAELKKQFDETQESLSRIAQSMDTIQKAREGFRMIAQRAAVCFDSAQYLREINPLYQTSFRQFQALYEVAVSHSDRLSVKAVLEKLTYSAFCAIVRGLFERDRLVYSLLLAIEVEESLGNIGPGEREFIVSPNYSSVVMSALGYTQSPESRIVQAKKPFDWMTDDQFHNLQVLATHFEWFQEMFDRMPKDGRETVWRNMCESDLPELQPLPDKMDDVFNPMQRFCVVRAVRSDRLIPAAVGFISSVLGKKYTTDVPPDLSALLRQSASTIPIVMLFDIEADTAVKLFTDFANRRQNSHVEIYLTDNGPAAERAVRRQIQKGMTEGQWVLLHNAHNCPHLLKAVESLLSESAFVSSQSDQTFRLWITSKALPQVLPVRLIQNSVKILISSSKMMKDSLVRSMTWMDADILKQANRSDCQWPAMLHNLCFLHASIQLRARFGQGGWNCPEDFLNIGFRELQEGVNFAVGEFKEPLFMLASDGTVIPRLTSWTGIRYILAEVVYGSYITDPGDQLSLSAMVDYWISPTAIKKDFEVARLKYRLPQAFFSSNARLNTLVQALDSLNPLILDIPEGCHLHPNVETLLGDDQYIFTRLNKIFDMMPSSPTLSHKLFPRPPTPFIGPPLAGVSSQSNNPAIVEQGVFSTASFATYKMRKEVELWEICHSMLQRVPKAYNKDYIIERVKKIGGFTTFNNFVMKELDVMYQLLNEIKTTLTAIKLATESNLLGDQMSEHTLSVADDLYHLRIPQLWCDMSGYSAPPLTWSLGQWVTELQSRCHHFERILTLGREKMPAYWLGAFFNPRGLLALVKQESIQRFSADRGGYFEQFVFQTEVTSRDKDHLRDPPQEGMFVFGIYIWGCTWEKTTGELQDLPPRTACAALPVVHLTCWPFSEKPIAQDATRLSETYQCPVYHSRLAAGEVVMELDVRREGIPATRWALRGLSATIRPY